MLPIILFILFATLLYWRMSRPFKYWQERGVPFETPSLFFGNLASVIFQKTSMAELSNYIYQKHWQNRYVGIYLFSKPALVVQDPELIKLVCVKEFDAFSQRNVFTSTEADPIWSNTLFAMPGGKRWKDMRAVLSPTFTSSKLRAMFTLIDECAKQFTQHLIDKDEFIKLEMKDTFSKVTNDVFASTAFGVRCDSMKNPDNEVFIMGKDVSNFDGFWKSLNFFIMSISITLAKVMKVRFISKTTTDFFRRIVKEAVESRKKMSTVRPDLIQLLMEAQKDSLTRGSRFEISDDIMTAQALGFFLAGFDTVSTALSYIAYELAINKDIQQKLIQEIDDSLKQSNDEITHDRLLELKYLDMVVSEALRKWPPVAITDRCCTRAITMAPVADEEPFRLDTNIVCQIPIYAIHRDERYYPEPQKFDPERFSDENKQSIKPFTYMPFGVGPRVCIGSRFALLEVKTVIFNILTKFEIVPVEETSVPLVLSKTNVNPVPDKGYWLGFKPRK